MLTPRRYVFIQNLSHPAEGDFSFQAWVHSANRMADLPTNGEKIYSRLILAWEGNRGSNLASPWVQAESGLEKFRVTIARGWKHAGQNGVPLRR